ncbi:hypothetical protein [Paenibacillus sp. 453mf]|uniref:hypothetical protein n=1 Tax=Paenibacillus sp. 453mf TaxID=1761874 RepID=UPI0008DF207D|nr:hypothetical protein [Paenibacillus sp. 453mf]SFS99585.1 hypothetical protein SAMN04488601_1168 [Paenibacillus sp. 453mf]
MNPFSIISWIQIILEIIIIIVGIIFKIIGGIFYLIVHIINETSKSPEQRNQERKKRR